MQFVFKRDDLRTVVIARIVDGTGHNVAREIIFAVARRCRDNRLAVKVVVAAFEQGLVVVGRVDVELDADKFQIRLRGFGKEREFLARSVRQITQLKIFAVLVDVTVAVSVRPARVRQKFFRAVKVVRCGVNCVVAERQIRGERSDCGRAVAVEEHFAKAVLVNRHRNCAANVDILQFRRVEVERNLIDARSVRLRNFVAVTEKFQA